MKIGDAVLSMLQLAFALQGGTTRPDTALVVLQHHSRENQVPEANGLCEINQGPLPLLLAALPCGYLYC